jgi:hypothetical protein
LRDAKSIANLKREFDVSAFSPYLFADVEYVQTENYDKLAELPMIQNLPLKVIKFSGG